MGLLWGTTPEQDQMSLLLGSSLLGGQNVQQQLGGIGPAIAPMMAQQATNKQNEAVKNRTLEMLKVQSPELAQMVETGALTPSDAMNKYWQQRAEAQKPKRPNILSVGNGMLYDMDSRQYITPPEGTGNNDVERGLNPIWGKDKDGNTVLGTLGKDGSFRQVEVPEGFMPTPGTSTVDLGTSIGIRDNKSGNIIQQLPKDIAGVEQQKVAGKMQGENLASLPDTIAKSEQALSVIDKAISHPGREKTTGLNSVIDPRTYIPGTDSADFQAVAKQIEGKAFLEAFESLKGGGQITEIEGQKATQAIARLSLAQSDDAYKHALLDLREVVESGLRRARTKAGETQTAPQQINDGVNTTSSGVKWKVPGQ